MGAGASTGCNSANAIEVAKMTKSSTIEVANRTKQMTKSSAIEVAQLTKSSTIEMANRTKQMTKQLSQTLQPKSPFH